MTVPSDLQAVVDDLAAVLHRSVVIDDVDKRLLAASAHWGDEDPIRVQAVLHRRSDAAVRRALSPFHIEALCAPARIPGDPATGRKPRVAVPVRVAGTVVACLWLIDDGRMSKHDVQAAVRAADLAAGVLAAREAARDAACGGDTAARHRDLLADLLGPDRARWGPAAATLVAASDLEPGAGVVVVVAHGTAGEPAVRRGRVAARLGDEVVAVVPPAEAAATAADLIAAGGCAGVGTDTVAPECVADAVAAARLAARVAAVGPPLGPVAHADALGVHGVLAALPLDALARAVPDAVVRLAAARGGADLCATLRRYLDNAGDARRTAENLFLHRTTLYDRLTRITELTGLDLHDGRATLGVHLGLVARELLDAWASPDSRRV